MSLLIDGIGELVINDPTLGTGPQGVIADAALLVDGNRAVWAGPCPAVPQGCVVPGFVDSHGCLVLAGDRAAEFAARMPGREALRSGTTTFQTTSGYGLTTQDEARSLRIAGRHTDEVTFLGAHVVHGRVGRRQGADLGDDRGHVAGGRGVPRRAPAIPGTSGDPATSRGRSATARSRRTRAAPDRVGDVVGAPSVFLLGRRR